LQMLQAYELAAKRRKRLTQSGFRRRANQFLAPAERDPVTRYQRKEFTSEGKKRGDKQADMPRSWEITSDAFLTSSKKKEKKKTEKGDLAALEGGRKEDDVLLLLITNGRRGSTAEATWVMETQKKLIFEEA